MTDIVIFENREFGTIRTATNEEGEPLFCAKDVAEALGYKNTRDALHKHVEKEDVAKRDTLTNGGTQQVTFINESGLFSLILSSKLESARRFKHWVTAEVLPAIRRQGGYMMARTDETDEELLARALMVMQTTLKRREEQIARLQPRADYADHVLDAVSCFTTTQVAKGMNMTAQELNRLLCNNHIQYWQSGQYLLYAPYARMGLATNRIHLYNDKAGMPHTNSMMVWTERGRDFIYRLMTTDKMLYREM